MLNFPILYSSTFQLSDEELKKYIFEFQEHDLNFTVFDNLRFSTYHKYEDNLYIRLDWDINTLNRTNFKIPTDLEQILVYEKMEILKYQKGYVINYSSDLLSAFPGDASYNTFHNKVRRSRQPLREFEHKTLEYPRNQIGNFSDEELNTFISQYRKFNEYLLNKANSKNKTS